MIITLPECLIPGAVPGVSRGASRGQVRLLVNIIQKLRAKSAHLVLFDAQNILSIGGTVLSEITYHTDRTILIDNIKSLREAFRLYFRYGELQDTRVPTNTWSYPTGIRIGWTYCIRGYENITDVETVSFR
jgi:hypothetical protein